MITLFMDTAETMLSTETVGSCKTHDHEAEIRERNLHTPQLHYEDFLRKAYAVILRYTTEFSWPRMSQNEPPKAQKFSHHTPVHPPLLHPLPPSTSHLVFAKKITSVSPEGSISHKPREGLRPCTYTDRLTRSG